ncbi:hypothetical protein [Sulfobacillus thermotolerans]|uniref:hypothetical protein n=1 Tax=Sulfobacillus thermotolerans TaxID=338644 RepID=UPI0033673012
MGHGTKVVKRLQQNSLTTADITAVSMANTAPAMSFFFSFATIAAAAGIASPLAIVVAAIVILLKINSLVEFTRVTPSTGSYISYIGKTFGPVAGVMAAWALSFGFIVAVGFVIAVLGGWTSLILQQFLHVTVAWQFFSILFVLVVGYLVYRGVKISTKWAAAMFAFELLHNSRGAGLFGVESGGSRLLFAGVPFSVLMASSPCYPHCRHPSLNSSFMGFD